MFPHVKMRVSRKIKTSFPSLKEKLEFQRDRELKIDTYHPQYFTVFKYGIRRDSSERFLLRSIGEVRLFEKKINCSVVIPAIRSSSLLVNLLKDLNQRKLKQKNPDERKYVIYIYGVNSLTAAPFGVVTGFPDDPNAVFNSPSSSSYQPSTSSSQIDLKYITLNFFNSIMDRSNSTAPASIGTQIGTGIWYNLIDSQLTASMWSTEFAIAEVAQQNTGLLLKKYSEMKVSLRCANHSQANAKLDAD